MSDVKNAEGLNDMETKGNLSIPTWAAIFTLCFAVASGSWALCTEVHNSRIESIVLAIEKNDTAISGLRAVDAARAVEMEHFSTNIDNLSDTLEEVRADVKKLLTESR